MRSQGSIEWLPVGHPFLPVSTFSGAPVWMRRLAFARLLRLLVRPPGRLLMAPLLLRWFPHAPRATFGCALGRLGGCGGGLMRDEHRAECLPPSRCLIRRRGVAGLLRVRLAAACGKRRLSELALACLTPFACLAWAVVGVFDGFGWAVMADPVVGSHHRRVLGARWLLVCPLRGGSDGGRVAE